MSITSDQFRKTMSVFPTGITVVTTAPVENQDMGITISSLTSVSLSPPQILFCLSKNSRVMPYIKASSYFSVSILSAEQEALSSFFTTPSLVEWKKVETQRHPLTKCLLLSGALAHIICEKGVLYEGGDHAIILGTVIDVNVAPSMCAACALYRPVFNNTASLKDTLLLHLNKYFDTVSNTDVFLALFSKTEERRSA